MVVEKSKEIIREGFEKFNRLASAFSGGKDSLVLTRLVLDVVEENGYEQPIFLVSDPLPFEENENFVRRIIKEFGIKNAVFYRELIKEEYVENAMPFGKDKQKCCYWLKVKPLEDFIEKYKIDALFVAIRWDEHPERAKETYFSKRDNHVRIHPLLHWEWIDIWEYIRSRDLPFNPLYLKGYTSLGCEPCTSIVKHGGFKDINEIIEFIKSKKAKEREGRDIDKELIMERLRALGYF